MGKNQPRHAHVETVRDNEATHYEAGEPEEGMPERSNDSDNENAVNDAQTTTKTNVELIAQAAAQLKITDEDVIIAVMGLTGVGKSTFIKLLSDSEIIIGHDLKSCTVNVGVHPFYLNDGRQAYLIDTPGFDDGLRTEAEILEQVSNFFAATYSMKIKLAGVIYLHRISDNRMSRAMLKNLQMLKKLCGKNCYPRIVLATTMWDTMTDTQRAIQNEAQLADTHDWWGDLAEEGAIIMRQDDGAKSAMNIVEHIMSFSESAVMDNQIERVDQDLALEDCESGKVIHAELIKQKEEHEKQMQEWRKFYEEKIEEGDAKAAEKLKKMEQKHEEKTKKINESHAILARKFDASDKARKEQIKKHNAEMDKIKEARVAADKALEKALKDFADFKKDQTEKDKQWQAERDNEKEAFDKVLTSERREYAEKEAAIVRRIDEAVNRAQASRRTSRGALTSIAGAFTAGLGAVTLQPWLIAMGATMAVGGGGRAMYKLAKD